MGTQPWAMASSTETDTESLTGRLTYQRARAYQPACVAASSRPTKRTCGGAAAWSAASRLPSLASTSALPGQARPSKTCSTRLGA